MKQSTPTSTLTFIAVLQDRRKEYFAKLNSLDDEFEPIIRKYVSSSPAAEISLVSKELVMDLLLYVSNQVYQTLLSPTYKSIQTPLCGEVSSVLMPGSSLAAREQLISWKVPETNSSSFQQIHLAPIAFSDMLIAPVLLITQTNVNVITGFFINQNDPPYVLLKAQTCAHIVASLVDIYLAAFLSESSPHLTNFTSSICFLTRAEQHTQPLRSYYDYKQRSFGKEVSESKYIDFLQELFPSQRVASFVTAFNKAQYPSNRAVNDLVSYYIPDILQMLDIFHVSRDYCMPTLYDQTFSQLLNKPSQLQRETKTPMEESQEGKSDSSVNIEMLEALITDHKEGLTSLVETCAEKIIQRLSEIIVSTGSETQQVTVSTLQELQLGATNTIVAAILNSQRQQSYSQTEDSEYESAQSYSQAQSYTKPMLGAPVAGTNVDPNLGNLPTLVNHNRGRESDMNVWGSVSFVGQQGGGVKQNSYQSDSYKPDTANSNSQYTQRPGFGNGKSGNPTQPKIGANMYRESTNTDF